MWFKCQLRSLKRFLLRCYMNFVGDQCQDPEQVVIKFDRVVIKEFTHAFMDDKIKAGKLDENELN